MYFAMICIEDRCYLVEECECLPIRRNQCSYACCILLLYSCKDGVSHAIMSHAVVTNTSICDSANAVHTCCMCIMMYYTVYSSQTMGSATVAVAVAVLVVVVGTVAMAHIYIALWQWASLWLV
jgi:hypothetical protein